MAKKLTQAQVHRLHQLAIAASLDRDDLLEGIDRRFVLSLRRSASPLAQILTDLGAMNGMEPLVDGTVPLVSWLRNAVHLAGARAEATELKLLLADVEGLTEPSTASQDAEVPLGVAGPAEESILQSRPFSWRHRSAIGLRDLLVNAYSDVSSAQHLARTAGVDLGRWDNQRGIEPAWNSLLEIAASQAKLGDLIALVLRDPGTAGYHKLLRNLLRA